jgi:hypothetical protein
VPAPLEHATDHVGQAGVIVHDQDARHQATRWRRRRRRRAG